MARKITTQLELNDGLELAGWYQGKDTYIWLGWKIGPIQKVATLSGYKLKRLCKTILKEMEKK